MHAERGEQARDQRLVNGTGLQAAVAFSPEGGVSILLLHLYWKTEDPVGLLQGLILSAECWCSWQVGTFTFISGPWG